jgi:hemolysin activation/secretion protein
VKLVSTTADDLTVGTNLRFFDQAGTWLTLHNANFGQSDSVEGRDYLIYTGSLIRLQYYQNGSSLIFRSSLQLSDTDDLPSFNQIIVGGTSTVRGYSEGLLSGDMGYTLSAEYAYPLGLIGDQAQRSNLFVFLDHGAAFPFRGDDGPSTRSKDYLTSAGVGLDFDVFDSVLFKLSVGVPLQNESFYRQDDYRVNAILNWTGRY